MFKYFARFKRKKKSFIVLAFQNQKHNPGQGKTTSTANNRNHAPSSLHALLQVFKIFL
jgi:prephenate dehydratase